MQNIHLMLYLREEVFICCKMLTEKEMVEEH